MARYEMSQDEFGSFYYDRYLEKKMARKDVLESLNDGAFAIGIAEKLFELTERMREAKDRLENE